MYRMCLSLLSKTGLRTFSTSPALSFEKEVRVKTALDKILRRQEEQAAGFGNDPDPEGVAVRSVRVPTEHDLDRVYDGKRYDELPVVHLKCTRNNTIAHLTDYRGRYIALTSCGLEGFRNAKKQTTVASQTTGVGIGLRALKAGVRLVRVKVRGNGQGRLPALQGMTLSGLRVVSISDDTWIPGGLGFRAPRPRVT